MAMVGMRTESIYRRYAIVDEAMLREGGDKLAAFGQTALAATVVPLPRGHQGVDPANDTPALSRTTRKRTSRTR